MTAAIWIAIATAIATLVTSWTQFWLKERSEKNKALAAAKPDTNQPKPVRTGSTPRSFIRENKLMAAILFLALNSALLLGVSILANRIPLTIITTALLVYVVTLVVLVVIHLFRISTRSI